MKTSQFGIDMIKKFEGCRLHAYKPIPTEVCWTIGYGHYGSDVTPNMVITQADLQKYENAVQNYVGFPLNQNQLDSLVSFAYNCGIGNLKKLVSGRTAPQVADAMLKYTKAGGKVLPGLARRRQEERALFLSSNPTGNPYPMPEKPIQLNSKGNGVRWLQVCLNRHGYGLIVDGMAGPLTIGAITDWQRSHSLEPDGIAGPKTIESLM